MRRTVGIAGVAALFLLLAAGSTLVVPERARGLPTVDYVMVVDAPGGMGSWVSGRDYLFGDTDTFYIGGYNTTSGWVMDLSGYWLIGNFTPSSWYRGVVRTNVTYGPSVQVLTIGYGVTAIRAYTYTGGHSYQNVTGPLRVSVENVDSVVIRSEPAGQGSYVGDSEYVEGATDTFYAAAYNATWGFLGDITSNWTSSDPAVGSIVSSLDTQCRDGTAGGYCYPYATFTALRGGFTYVTAAPVGTSLSNTTGKLTVIGIDSIRIVDAPGGTGSWVSGRNYMFADTETFYAAAYNDSSGWIADVNATWSSTPDPSHTGGSVVMLNATKGTSVSVFAVGYGVAYVGAAFQHPGGGTTVYNATGHLRVSVANVDSVVIRTDRGGFGAWVGDTTYEPQNTDHFYAAAYNATTGYLGDIAVNWSSTNYSIIYIPGNGRVGASSATIYAGNLGHAWVNATPAGTSLVNTTGKLTVTGIAIDYVQIRDAPNGGGQVLGSRTYYAREQDTFYAATYNNTLGYRGDAASDWSSNDTAVCQVYGYNPYSSHGSSVQVLMKAAGVCAVTVKASTVSGMITNTTGPLTVLARTLVTVDDSGGADFTTIQAAVDYAQDGYTVYVYNGTYDEHVVVTKEIEIEGDSKQTASHQTVILEGGNTGTALFIGADRVVIHNLTIQNASYGVFQDHTNNTRLYDSVVQDYGTGVYNNYTLNAWVAYNLITRGEIGVVAYKAYDDAIRWNVISYNTEYGGKGYNAHLRNCFNWNNLNHNHIGYYYDPTTDLPPMEFDGNVIADNDVGVKVSDSSAITLTNNTITGGQTGVQLINSNSEVRANALSGMQVGITFQASSSNLTGNTIEATQAGIVGDGGAPRIVGNDIHVTSGSAMDLSNLDGAVIQGNDVHGGTIRISDSHIALLAPVNSDVILVDTTVQEFILDASSRVQVQWTLRVRAVDANGAALGGASVSVRDARGSLVFSSPTGRDGFTPGVPVTTEVRTQGGVEERNPFAVDVSYGSARASRSVTVTAAGDVEIRVPVGTPAALLAVVAAAMLASASLAGVLAVDRSRYALFLFLAPLYSRLSKDKVLESYNRGRVYEYVELNPGSHFHAILAALDMNTGSLVYHLDVLQREGLVTSRAEGMYRTFFPADARPPPIVENGTTPTQKIVLKAIEEMPGVTQRELARFLGLRQSTLAYQTDRLTAMGYISAEKRGRKVHYTAKKGGN